MKKHYLHSSPQGFTLVEIMIVVAIIGILAAIAIPQLIESRKMSKQNKCLNALKVMEYAREQLALNLSLTSGTSLNAGQITLANRFIQLTPPLCPQGSTLNFGRVGGTAPSCPYHGTRSAPTALSALTGD